MPFEQSRDIFLLKRRGSGRKYFVIISGRSYEHKRNIISKKQTHSRLGRLKKLTKERALAVTGIKQCGCRF
jgi:hypothetical protein